MSSRGGSGEAGAPFALDHAVADVYAAQGLTPLLHALLEHSARSIGSVAGSISVVDWEAGRYSKLAERGVRCRLGQAFPLDEGATGAAVSRRRPVVIDSAYAASVTASRSVPARSTGVRSACDARRSPGR